MRLFTLCSFLLLFISLSVPAQTPVPHTEWTHHEASHFYRQMSSADPGSVVGVQQFFDSFQAELGLRAADKMILETTKTDALEFSHHRFVQTFQGLPVYGGGMILHERNGVVEKANGQIYSGLSLDVHPRLTVEDAREVAFQALHGTNPVAVDGSLLILPGQMYDGRRAGQLCYSIHVHSDLLIEDKDVYVDAHTGQIVQTISNICLGDEEGTANTLFSGTQTITTDENGGIYTLKESGRPIETLNLNHAVDLGSVTDFTDDDNNWTEQIKVLRSVNINAIGPGWWEDIPGDVPDIYLLIKDGSGATVATTPVMKDVVPPFSVPLQLTLTNPPYSISIFEDDDGPQKWGGQFNVSTSLGTKTFSILGNMGTYESVQENDPGLDAHWGVEQTYDYYMNVHNRNSFDGQGGQIISYVHFAVGWPNAFWSNNSLKLGDGDGVTTTHRTYLNVVAHEITHGVINENGGGGLKYQGESGALSESFADIFGTAVEHFAKPSTADWLHGEEGSLVPGEYVRSMADPRAKGQPDTYGPNDSFWANPQDTMVDFGGVHINSGVQNHWFYLLSEGGSDVNENGYAYIIDGIGLQKAEQIAYRNLTQYISASVTSTFEDSRMGSIMAAEDLYGAGSPEVMTVQKAWAAVGVGTFDPGPTCMGLTELTDPSGPIGDGSGMFDYGHNADCTWLINPAGANSISLNFAEFDVAAGDTLTVYDGGDANATVLATLSGNTLPGVISSSDGILFMQFTTDGSGAAPGWSLDYTSSFMTYCTGAQVLTTTAGDLEDGSGTERYGNESHCTWLIQPVNAKDITLTFTAFDTEEGYDYVTVFDGEDENAPILGDYSGGTLPASVTSSGGDLFIRFTSDDLVRAEGWSASYMSSEITSTQDPEDPSLWRIYPNPASGELMVELPEWSGTTSMIRLWNVYGQLVKDEQVTEGNTQVWIDLLDLHPGVYQVMWSAGDQQLIGKLLVK